MKSRLGFCLLAVGMLVHSGCSQGYDAAMESAGAETTTTEVAADGTAPAEASTDAPAQQTPPNGKLPDVNSSGPVGKTILAPTDALD